MSDQIIEGGLKQPKNNQIKPHELTPALKKFRIFIERGGNKTEVPPINEKLAPLEQSREFQDFIADRKVGLMVRMMTKFKNTKTVTMDKWDREVKGTMELMKDEYTVKLLESRLIGLAAHAKLITGLSEVGGHLNEAKDPRTNPSILAIPICSSLLLLKLTTDLDPEALNRIASAIGGGSAGFAIASAKGADLKRRVAATFLGAGVGIGVSEGLNAAVDNMQFLQGAEEPVRHGLAIADDAATIAASIAGKELATKR